MVLPNFDYKVVLALVTFGNDAQARTSLRKQYESVLTEDWSQYSTPTNYFNYSNNRKKKDD